MILKITKETVGKCGITTVNYYNKKKIQLNYGKK